MREAEDASASYACAALEEVDAAAALITISRELRIAEDSEFRHRQVESMRLNAPNDASRDATVARPPCQRIIPARASVGPRSKSVLAR